MHMWETWLNLYVCDMTNKRLQILTIVNKRKSWHPYFLDMLRAEANVPRYPIANLIEDWGRGKDKAFPPKS